MWYWRSAMQVTFWQQRALDRLYRRSTVLHENHSCGARNFTRIRETRQIVTMSQIVMVMRCTAPVTNVPEYSKRNVWETKPEPLAPVSKIHVEIARTDDLTNQIMSLNLRDKYSWCLSALVRRRNKGHVEFTFHLHGKFSNNTVFNFYANFEFKDYLNYTFELYSW